MSLTKKKTSRPSSTTLAHVNTLLDEALEETFPASDPISICLGHETPRDAIAVRAKRHAPCENPISIDE